MLCVIVCGLVAVAAPARAQPAPTSGVAAVQLPYQARDRVEFRGSVAAMHPMRSPNNDGYWFEVGVATTRGAPRTLVMRAQAIGIIPLQIGQRIHVDIDCRSSFHYGCDAVVRDVGGALLFAHFGRGARGSGLLPEWTAERTSSSRLRAGRRETALQLRYRNTTARITCERWSRVLTADGAFLATGCASAHALRPGQRPPPDYSTSETWSITRVPPTAAELRRIQRLQQTASPPPRPPPSRP